MRGASARQPGWADSPRKRRTPQAQKSCYEDDAGTTPSPAIASPQRQLNLARASDWPTARQRTRPHPEARRQGRRYVVKRSAAIAAVILRRALHAQPVAARRTTRIQTLHGPTGQILHSFASQTHGPGDGRESEAAEAPRTTKTPRTGGIVRRRL